MRRAGIIGALVAVQLFASAPARASAVAITAPAEGAELTGVVPVTATAPDGTASVSFAWSPDAATWTEIATDADGSDGWRAAWDTRPHDGAAFVRATAATPDGEQTHVVTVTLRNAPLLSVGVTRTRFSPNGDGRLDTTSVSARANEPSALTVSVVSATGATRRTWSATGSTIAVTWNGRDAAGRHVADGAYSLVVSARDAAGNVTTIPRSVVVDTIRPRVVWSGITPEPSSGTVRQYFTFAVRDADTAFRGGLWVRGVAAGAGSRTIALSSRVATVTWLPSRALFPGTYRTGIRVSDRAGNLSATAWRAWRVHRAVGGRIVMRVEDRARRMALTFDDCYEGAAWRSVLDVLRAKRARASFFCPGETLAIHPGLARRSVAEGHSVGSHGWDHANLAGRSDHFVRSRLLADRTAWWRYGRATSAPYFRPPYGAYDARVVRIAGETSMPRVMMWDVDPRDWTRPGASVITSRVVSRSRGGSVVVLHTIAQTARALPAMIDGLRARGLRPVSLDQLYANVG